MSHATVAEGACRQSTSASSSCQPMPLAFLRCGDVAKVVRVRGKGEVHHHLENLGFVEGASVSVVSFKSRALMWPSTEAWPRRSSSPNTTSRVRSPFQIERVAIS